MSKRLTSEDIEVAEPEQLRGELARLLTENESLRAQVSQIERDIKGVKGELVKEKRVGLASKETLDESFVRDEEDSNTIKVLKAQEGLLLKKIEKLTLEKENLTTELNSKVYVQSDNESLSKKIAVLNEELKKVTLEKLQILDNQDKALEDQKRQLEAGHRADARTILKEQDTELAKKQAEADTKVASIEKESSREIERLKEELKNLQDQLDEKMQAQNDTLALEKRPNEQPAAGSSLFEEITEATSIPSPTPPGSGSIATPESAVISPQPSGHSTPVDDSYEVTEIQRRISELQAEETRLIVRIGTLQELSDRERQLALKNTQLTDTLAAKERENEELSRELALLKEGRTRACSQTH